ncbi:MAG: hypothetical protein AB8H03_07235 [Saprospiraceae bacterium]
MKKGIHLILLLIFSTSLFSQQEDSNLKNDIGINVNAILNKVVFKKVNDEITNPFPDQLSILTYRRFVSPKLALRFGFGFDQFSKNDTSFSTFGAPLIEDDKFDFYAFHFGIQKTMLEAKRVKLTLGWDWFFRREQQDRIRNDFVFISGIGTTFNEVDITNFYKELNVGFGIPVGIQYFFNDHIFISTEFSLEVFQTFSKSKSENNGSANNDFRDNPDITNIKFRPPLAMFLHYRF